MEKSLVELKAEAFDLIEKENDVRVQIAELQLASSELQTSIASKHAEIKAHKDYQK